VRYWGDSAVWRVIVRISYFHDAGSGLRNQHVVPLFNALGLQNTATGTFESPAVDQIQAAGCLSQVLQAVADPQQFHDVDAQAAWKHLWFYMDRVLDPPIPSTQPEESSVSPFHVTNESSEDTINSTTDLSDAVRMAREAARTGPAGDVIYIEHQGKNIKQFVLQPNGEVVEASLV